MLEFVSVKAEDEELIKKLSDTASQIIKAYYDPILGTEQNDYMIEKFQSVKGINEQLRAGYLYYLVTDPEPVGFFAYCFREEKLYLSKFYLAENARGKGYGRKIFEFLKEQALLAGYDKIFLNVNKHNDDTISLYKHLGFELLRLEKNDIGHGYYMDDYVLQCVIK